MVIMKGLSIMYGNKTIKKNGVAIHKKFHRIECQEYRLDGSRDVCGLRKKWVMKLVGLIFGIVENKYYCFLTRIDFYLFLTKYKLDIYYVN